MNVECLCNFGINKTVNETNFSEAQEQCVGKSTAIVFKVYVL